MNNTLPLTIVMGMIFLISLAFTPVKADESKTAIKEETALETQVREVARELRCPVCQGESVYDSNAEVAVQMKNLIAEKLQAGESKEQIIRYFTDRYGNFMLMKPPAEGVHWLIWLLPVFLGLLGVLLVFRFISSMKHKETTRADDETSSQDIEELHL